MPSLESSHLVLFMTGGMSLAQWDRQGMFEREVALYRAVRPHVASLALVTYGDETDLAYVERLPGIEILCNRTRLPGPLYAALIPRLHSRSLARATVLKTNQMKGAEAALNAKRRTGAQLIVRCGYMWSVFAAEFRQGLGGLWNHMQAVRTERAAFRQADAICVTTPDMKTHVIREHHVPETRITIIPNYVIDEFFTEPKVERQAGPSRMIFVGRLEIQKSPLTVIEAARGLEVEVTVIGRGSLQPEMERRAAEAGVRCEFIPNVPHHELPARLAASDVFILPSTREGHPKALIEAMAAGLAVIGADAPGIRDLIRHEETGLLCADDDPADFRAATARLLADPALRARLGHNAREFAREHYSFDKVLQAELNLLSQTAAAGKAN